MIDGRNTSPEWQAHDTDILILPVGAFEQHSVHLPLATDTLQGDYFARRLAEALDAALLPAVAIATSMEHTGFRGSFSLRPETLMQIVRDIADEAARQHFRILIVLNAHGGNHALVPVCRDINRRDGSLKVLLVYYWEHGHMKVVDADPRPGLDIHANAMETSLMLALHPDLVRPERVDAHYTPDQLQLRQSDLTMFGIGNMNPTGALGWPSEGTAENGAALIESIVPGLVAHVRDRIARLRNHPRYAGPGGLTLRPLHHADIPDGMRLKSIAGWNQTETDWRMLLDAAPGGCFAMAHQGRVIGTVTTTPYGSLAWIGMVLVDPALRGMGIATRLMDHALAKLAGTDSVKLDATPAGRAVYAKLGFHDEYTLTRWTHPTAPALPGDTTGVRPMAPTDLPAVRARDLLAFGVDRGAILETLFAAATGHAFVHTATGVITGFALGRAGTTFAQIGPIVADSPEQALRLLRAALHARHGQPVLLDIPDAHSALRTAIADLGFVPQRPFIRMFRGPNHPGQPAHLFASAGPELG